MAWWAQRSARRSGGFRRLLLIVAAIAAALVTAIQLVPYGRDHVNPAVTAEPAWDSPETRALAVVACFDCHSNETLWPWYTDVAPISWFVTNHVDEGRNALNLSNWDRPQDEADEIEETIRDGSMPPFSYILLHPGAGLDDAEKAALIEGLELTFRSSPPIGGGDD